MSMRKIVSKPVGVSADTYTGEVGELWFDPENPVIKASNGSTPGGVEIGGSGGGGPIVPILEWTGNLDQITITSITPRATVVYPSGTTTRTSGCWISEFSYNEDEKDNGATAISLVNVVGITNELYVEHTTSLVSISAPLLEQCDGMSIRNNHALTMVDFPNLKISTSGLRFEENDLLEQVYFPSLEITDGFRVENLPLVTTVDYTSIMPNIIDAGSVEINNSSVVSLNIVADTIGSMYIYNNNDLVDMNVDVIEFGYTSIYGLPALQTVTFSNRLKRIDYDSFELNAALNEESVDNILTMLAALDGTNGTTEFANADIRLQGDNAPPSAVGEAARLVLEGRNCTVNVNS